IAQCEMCSRTRTGLRQASRGSARPDSQAGLVEEFDAVDLKGGADRVEVAAMHGRHVIDLLGPRDRRFRYPAVLCQIVHRPAQQGARRANLSACDCRSCSLQECTHATVTRHTSYLSRELAAQYGRTIGAIPVIHSSPQRLAIDTGHWLQLASPQLTPFHIGTGPSREIRFRLAVRTASCSPDP